MRIKTRGWLLQFRALFSKQMCRLSRGSTNSVEATKPINAPFNFFVHVQKAANIVSVWCTRAIASVRVYNYENFAAVTSSLKVHFEHYLTSARESIYCPQNYTHASCCMFVWSAPRQFEHIRKTCQNYQNKKRRRWMEGAKASANDRPSLCTSLYAGLLLIPDQHQSQQSPIQPTNNSVQEALKLSRKQNHAERKPCIIYQLARWGLNEQIGQKHS